MWNVTNAFVVNLSVADLLNTVFNCIFSYTFMKSGYDGFFIDALIKANVFIRKFAHLPIIFTRNWIFGSAFCTANHFFSFSTVCASAFTLSAISFDRSVL